MFIDVDSTPLALPTNFRDVGACINQLAQRNILRTGTLYRSGEFDKTQFVHRYGVRTVVSLRRRADPFVAGVEQVNLAPRSKMNNYQYRNEVFVSWVGELFHCLAKAQYPVLLHCSAGKDRTGVAVALLLRLLGVPHAVIEQEYQQSAGDTYPASLKNLLCDFRFSQEQSQALRYEIGSHLECVAIELE